MKIIKVINNNVVSCVDELGRESVAMGKGLGFAAHSGMELNQDKVEKLFHLRSQSETDQLKDLFSSISEEQIELCSRIIAYAGESLSTKLNPSIYLTLTDHINFAIHRIQQGILIQNALLTEVRTFYPREYAVGKYAVGLIRAETEIAFPADEAANIALHLVNAETDNSISETVRITQALHDILEILRQSKEISLNEDSSYFDEFTVNLKFLVTRIFNGQERDCQLSDLMEVVRRVYPGEYACADLVAEYLEKQSQYSIGEETKVYLAMNIHRVVATDR